MTRLLMIVIISLFATSAIAQDDLAPDQSEERLGIRAGWAGTSSNLENAFGDGLQLAIHWIQPLRQQVGVNVALSAFYMGETSRDDLTERLFFPVPDEVSLRIISFTVSPLVEFRLDRELSTYVSGGIGLYTATLLLDSGVFAGDVTDNHFGINGGAGLIYRIAANWSAELHGQIHKFWTGDELDDIVFAYSEGEQNPLFFNIAVGVMVRLF